MGKDTYHGPLEQVDPCCWRIPKSYRPGMLVEELFRSVPTGVGRSGRYKFDKKELARIMGEGPRYLKGRGLATATDLEHTEAEGCIDGADPSLVSDHALNRGAEQCGTLG